MKGRGNVERTEFKRLQEAYDGKESGPTKRLAGTEQNKGFPLAKILIFLFVALFFAFNMYYFLLKLICLFNYIFLKLISFS